jgi:penicillin-binding protein 1C
VIARRWALVVVGAALAPAAAFVALDILFPFPWEALERPAATVVADRQGTPLRFYLAADDAWRFPVEREALPDELVRTVVEVEDRFFYRHLGINPAAVVRAAWSNLRAGRVVSGASTIPMQIARMVDPAPRTLSSKLRESFRAVQLDLHTDKESLLEFYFNLAPYGSNIEGVGAASWFYFGKAPAQLSLGESALLAVLPRSPVGFDPTRSPDRARLATDAVLDRLEQREIFPAAEITAARRHSTPTSRRRQPWQAPHFADMVHSREGRAGTVTTTLDLDIEQRVERLVARRTGVLRGEGIGNAAAVVIEIDDRSVRALAGSAGYFENQYDGQNNGATALRSPGSTLKPFLYGLAMDSGEVLPDSFLLDIPTDYAGYVPENYDGVYSGRVPARQALVKSLNAPAVRLLSRVGLAAFHELLVRGGLDSLGDDARRFGLPLILGAGETRLLDLTNLYATLAAGGVHRQLKLVESNERSGEGDQLLSRESAWLVTDTLMEVERPDVPRAWDLTRDVPGVAWKTGTSYGHRDAWAIGFSDRYAVGVWVGNFDGKPVDGISGSAHAAPLLFEILRSIEPGGVAPTRPRGLRIAMKQLCSVSHQLPGSFCPKTVPLAYLPGRSRLSTCSVHRRVPVDREDGGMLTPDCAERPFDWRHVTVFPAELVAWQRAQGEWPDGLPVVSGHCRPGGAGEVPKIVSPDAATPYRVRRDAPVEYQKIALTARPAADARQLFWYQDGLLVGSADVGEPLFLVPSRGRHRIAVTDDLGRTDGTTYVVE